MLSWCKSALVCKSITVPRTSQFYVRGKSSPHGPISVSCQSRWVLSFRSGSTPVNSLRAAAKLLLRSCSSDVTAQPGGRSPKEPLAAASIVHHPSDLTQEQTSLGSLPPSWRGLSRKQKPPAQENISVIKGLACSLRMLPFLSVAAELMYYSHSPSCPDMSLAGRFLYCASLGEKVGLGCASAPINQNSSVSSVLQPGSWLPFAFFFFNMLFRDRSWREPWAPQGSPELGAGPGEAMSARGCVSVPCDGRHGRNATKDTAETAEASAREHRSSGEGGVSFLMRCSLVVEQIFPFKGTKPSK